jgi:transcriptional antiterminator NusG
MAMSWYTLKVQAEREEKIRETIEARIRAIRPEVQEQFGRILVPSEHFTEIRGGKKRVSKQKMYPGYLLIEMDLTDDSWFLVVETNGVASFVGPDRRHPVPMPEQEVGRLLREMEDKKEKPRPKIDFEIGDGVKIKEGPFENYDGVVEEVTPAKGLVRVSVSIFGRSTSIELEYSKVERL